ncbi:MAG: isochorismatase family cysteine hydrolase [Pseudomonadota bacterium]
MHEINIPAELLERAKGMRGGRDVVFERVDPAKTALVVVDLQNGFMEEGAPVEAATAREVVPNVNRIAAALREAGGLVTYLRYTNDATDPQPWVWYDDLLGEGVGDGMRDAFAAGGHFHALWPDLDVRDEDLVIDKTRFSGFTPGCSTLDAELRDRGIETLIICGTTTNCCCESTARDANQMNYNVIFVTDGCAALSDAEHNAALISMATIFADLQSTDRVLETLAASRVPAAAE